MKKSIWIILIAVLAVSAAGFLYTFVQPRYTATIVHVGAARSVTTHNKHGSRTHTVVPLTAVFTDGGQEQTADVKVSYPQGPLQVGQQIVIVRSFDGFVPYPFSGLRLFCGVVGGGIALFFLFMRMDRAKKRE